MKDKNNNAIVVQRAAAICASLVGTLISKGGKNTVVYNQEPSPEFVSNVELTFVYSDKNKLDCFASARNDKMAEFEEKMLNQVQNVANNKSVKNLVPSTTNLFSYCSNLPNTKKPSEEGNEVKLIFDYLHKPYKFMYVSVLIKPCYCCLSLEQVLD